MSYKKNWVTEEYKHTALSFEYTKVLFEGKSPFQKVQVFETKSHGRMLINDDCVMTCEKDEFIYHEMISQVPLFVHPNPEDVLIIGGGDGGTAREVLKHKSVKKCTMVEIDPLVVEVSKKYLQTIGTEFDNPLLELVFADGAKFLKDKKSQFDIIIVDSSDPIGPGKVLFEPPFYKNLFQALKPDGLMTAQGESPFFDTNFQTDLLKIAGNLFEIATLYNYNSLSYPCGLWSFLFASKKQHPLNNFNLKKWESSSLQFQYYNKDIHFASFVLPEFMKKNTQSLCKI